MAPPSISGSPPPAYSASSTSIATSMLKQGHGYEFGHGDDWLARKRKKKWIILFISAVFSIVVVVAVVVPVVVLKNSKSQYTDQELYFPRGINGTTGVNGPVDGTTKKNTTVYNELVVFGSSYSDNGHSRNPKYNTTFSPSGYWNHRWSNGPVWTEHLRDYLGNATSTPITHLNFAYGGASTNNSIHETAAPDTAQQMQWYLSQRNTSAKALVPMFTTTNDITMTFSDYLRNGSVINGNLTRALATISASARSLVKELQGLIPTDTTLLAPDYVILPILPVEITPHAATIANIHGRDYTDALRTDLRQITQQYNTVLLSGAQNISRALGNRGTVFSYDVQAWFYAIQTFPARYGITSIQLSCRVGRCSDPAQYVWWDDLHLVTSMQDRLAQTVSKIVLSGKGMT